MTDFEFEALVQRLDQHSKRSPSAYQRRVTFLAALGYGYVVAIVLVSVFVLLLTTIVAAKAPAIGIKLFLLVGAFLWITVRAMWVKLPPPMGRPVEKAEAPALFELLEQLRGALRGAPIDVVLVTEEFNAGVVQVPRLGLLGWHRNYLMLGLPLMKALNRKQFAAVVAHELGHLAGGRGRFANWIYRLRLGWMRLAALLEQSGSVGTFLFRPFFRWYVPYFNAYSFPLARANEYEADAASARLTSARTAAEALTTVNVTGHFLEAQYWPGIYKQADHSAQPTFSPYRRMGEALRNDIVLVDSNRWLEEALALNTSMANTHPSLSDRLRALGETAKFTVIEAADSADHLLEPSLTKITEELDVQWQEQTAPAWKQRFLDVSEGRKALKALREKASSTELSFDERFKAARLTEEFEGDFALALQQLKALNTEHPGHAPLSFHLGVRLLEVNDHAGIALVEHAVSADEDAILPGAQRLWDYFLKQGNLNQASKWEQCWRERAQILEEARKEREIFSSKDHFEPHGLSAAELTALREQLRRCVGIRKAWITKKQIKIFPNQPQFLLVFQVASWWNLRTARKIQQAYAAIQESVQLPDVTSMICVDEGSPIDKRAHEIGKRVRKVRGSRVL